MERENKKICCRYSVLVIILFAALAFVVDYAFIQNKMNDCNCPKYESSIEKSDAVSSYFDNRQYTCLEKSENECLLFNDSDLTLSISVKEGYDENKYESYRINGKLWELDSDETIYTIKKGLSGDKVIVLVDLDNGQSNVLVHDINGEFIESVK